MEEILASIRRIISEDDAPAESTRTAAADDDDDDDVLELTQTVDESRAGQAGDTPADEEEDVLELVPEVEAELEPEAELEAAELEPEPEPEAEIEPEPVPQAQAEPAPQQQAHLEPEPMADRQSYAKSTPRHDDSLISAEAATAAASAFGQLSAAASPQRDERTLEDITRELLAPMLRQWVDDNLPRIVEVAVREEIERISRSRAG